MNRPPSYRPDYAGLSGRALLGWSELMVLPGMALWKLTGKYEWYYIAGYAMGISLVTLCFYAADKGKAQRGEWRTPESRLHLLELAGGWPGAFLAQRIFWHKISKRSFQVMFWMIVFAYQVASYEWLTDGQLVRMALSAAGVSESAGGNTKMAKQELIALSAVRPLTSSQPWQVPQATPRSEEKQKAAKELRRDRQVGKDAKDSHPVRSQ
ncbi:hypothetical protein BH09VER1_BH09VER1_13590 [soil metagenome]